MPSAFTRLIVVLLSLLGMLQHARAAEPEISRGMGQLRLFTTIDDRNQLDRARRELDRQPVQTTPTKRVVAVKKPLPKVRVQGLVKRSSGEDTVWINGAGIESGKRRGDIAISSVRHGGQARVRVGGKSSVNLKPGQTFDPDSGRVRERVLIRKGQ